MGKTYFILAGAVLGLAFNLNAQTAMVGSFNRIGTPIQTAPPDSIVQVTAEAQGLSLVAPEDLPFGGTFWEVMPGGLMAPLPCPPIDQTLPIYAITDTAFLVDATGGQVTVNTRQLKTMSLTQTATSDAVASALDTQATAIVNLINQVQTASASQPVRTMAMAMGVPSPGGDTGSSTNSYSPNGAQMSPPDYGTNFWIAQWKLSNHAVTGFVSNTIASIPYEIQTNTDLATTNWGSTGLFIYGSETTNWTPLSFMSASLTNNCFFRLRSWASSDGSGLPDWWQEQYFGVSSGVDPYGDPAGDGYSNLQKFQAGMNPNQFYTPAAPQGLTARYNANAGTAQISWQPSAGQVTGYTITDSDGATFNVSASTTTMTDNVASDQPNVWDVTIPTTYTVRANYAPGNSAISAAVPLEAASFAGNIVAGIQGSPNLVVAAMPANATGIRLTEMAFSSHVHVTNFTVSISNFTNGTCALPNITTPTNSDYYYWVGQAVGADGSLSASAFLGSDFALGSRSVIHSITAPFYDGRRQLKDNLIFQLRVAPADYSLNFFLDYSNYYIGSYEEWDYGSFGEYSGPYAYPTNYAYASLYSFLPYDPSYIYQQSAGWSPALDAYLPYEENALFRNFVYSPADVNADGNLTTGATVDLGGGGVSLDHYPAYHFSTNSTVFPNLLSANDTRWLLYAMASYGFGGNGDGINVLGATGITSTTDPQTYAETYSMPANVHNWFGLPYVSALFVYQHSGNNPGLMSTLLNAGSTITLSGDDPYGPMENAYQDVYPETAPPQFQTVEYDFWNPNAVFNQASETWTNTPLPGASAFSTANTSQIFIAGVGSQIQIAGYAKLAIQNGYSGVYAYLGQYFDKAYKMTNGVATTNTTGVLSPYGNFFATEPGPTALVTMPDLDPPYQRGTCTVYTVSTVIDRSQASNMDLSFNGANATSANNPAQIWANNNMDRWHWVDVSDLEQDDLQRVDDSIYWSQSYPGPDYAFLDYQGKPAIPCTRDLEDYFRLWTPGLAAAMTAAPTNYTARLTLSGDGQIRIFRAYEVSGGTNYLFDAITASNQVVNSASLYVGLLTSSSPIVLTNRTNEHFIFCGAHTGTAQIDLQVLDGNQNVVADAPTYLQIKDIKEMYERWTVGDNSQVAPISRARLAANDMPDTMKPPFQYGTPTDTNTPYILQVHGYNMAAWESDRYAETAYKRLYWQGFHGRFGEFRWPTTIQTWTYNKGFDDSEFNAWNSATGLLNLLTNLNAIYPGKVYLTAHSHGNIVAGEALRRAGNNPVVNTYIAMQAAVPSHSYDPTAPIRTLDSTGVNLDSGTPNRYAHYYTDSSPCYFNGSAGAGTYVNFFNTNDWALTFLWRKDQDIKWDTGYHFDGTNFSSGFVAPYLLLLFPVDTYTIFSYCDEARCQALGAQADVKGVFQKNGTPQQIDLGLPPYSFQNQHKYHSGEFRSDNAQRWQFWQQVLSSAKLTTPQ